MAAGIALADRDGIESISMRKLAQELGVEAMSIYTHVRNKDDLLDGMVDAVIGQIPTTADGAGGADSADGADGADGTDSAADADWATTLRQMALAARAVILTHPWAPPVIESRTAPGPATLRYIDAALSVLRKGGFTVAQTHHALHILGSRLLGFTQDLFDDSAGSSGALDPETAAGIVSELGATLPYIAEMALAVTHQGALGGCDDDAEFQFALDFINDGLAGLQNR
ncbi:AcrR family transcriptional regulator [Catenulispora sp. MAP12-49]|uniref:TetR/AcrR family transcriptional regulator n=1 Tax=Catenulispora sp. MAP12-49 TaxID=3156302 RepID=UPI003516D950